MSNDLFAHGIRVHPITVQNIQHNIYVLESPGSLGIGGKVWDATYVLLDYLQTIPETLYDRSIIELGSGTGLVGKFILLSFTFFKFVILFNLFNCFICDRFITSFFLTTSSLSY